MIVIILEKLYHEAVDERSMQLQRYSKDEVSVPLVSLPASTFLIASIYEVETAV